MPVVRPGTVLVRMRAASLNFRDVLVVTGRYPRGQQETIIPLSDGAGEIVELGDGVEGFVVGDKVAPIFFQSWDRGPMHDNDSASALGGSIDGVAAEYSLFPSSGVIKVPNHLSYEEAACLPCAGLTAWNGLHGSSPVEAGDTVLTLGTGGVSIFALQLAQASGARVIVTSSSDEKLAKARGLGADHTVNYGSFPNWGAEVRQWTGGEGVDHVIETGGGGTLLQSIQATRRGGAIHIIGLIAPGEIDPVHILLGGVTLRGTEVGSREMFEAMNRSISHSQIRPIIDRVFGYEELPDALHFLAEGSHFGKIVIQI